MDTRERRTPIASANRHFTTVGSQRNHSVGIERLDYDLDGVLGLDPYHNSEMVSAARRSSILQLKPQDIHILPYLPPEQMANQHTERSIHCRHILFHVFGIHQTAEPSRSRSSV